jgi:glycosyltransferase involved in cell wall biosynthesis
MRVVMLLYHVPPDASIAGTRARRLLRHLPAHGVESVVVTPHPGSGASGDETRETIDGAPVTVIRFRGPDPLAALHRRRTRPSEPGGGSRGRAWKRLVRSFAVPDERMSLRPAWIRAALGALEGAHAVYSSSTPYTAHLVGRSVASRSRLPWVLEMRDVWAGNRYLPQHANPLSRLRQGILERACLHQASRVVVVSEAHRRHLAARYPAEEGKIRVVPTGFAPLPAAIRARRSPGPFRVVHAGSLYGGRRLDALARAVDAVQGDLAPFPGARLEVAGVSHERPWSEAVGPPGPGLQLHGRLSPEESGELIAAAHLGVVHNPAWDRIHVPGKLYDYLGAGVPVLHLGSQPDIEGLCAGTVPVWSAAPGDAGAIAAALREAAAWWAAHPEGPPLPGARHPLAEEASARALAEVLREATA